MKQEVNNLIKRINKLERRLAALFFVFLLAFTLGGQGLKWAEAAATGPTIITYQGRILDTADVPISNGSIAIEVALYDAASGGNCLYSLKNDDADTSTIDCGSNEPDDSYTVTLADGLFTVYLGDTSVGPNTFNEIPESVFQDNADVYIDIEIAGDQLTPRKQVVAAPYSVNASYLDGYDWSDQLTMTGDPSGTGVGEGSVYINPAAAGDGETLFGVADNGSARFQVDEDGDVTITSESATADAVSITAGSLTTGDAMQITASPSGAGSPLHIVRTIEGRYIQFSDGTDDFDLVGYPGSPESNVAADIGSLTLDTANGAVYVKTTDTVNTGWTQLATASGSVQDFDAVYDQSVTAANLTMEIDNGDLIFQPTDDNDDNFIVNLVGDNPSPNEEADFLIQDNGTTFFTFSDTGELRFDYLGANIDGFNINANNLTSGYAQEIASTGASLNGGGLMYLNYSGGSVNNYDILLIENNGSGNYLATGTGTSNVVINNNEWLGVGDSSPDARLDVELDISNTTTDNYASRILGSSDETLTNALYTQYALETNAQFTGDRNDLDVEFYGGYFQSQYSPATASSADTGSVYGVWGQGTMNGSQADVLNWLVGVQGQIDMPNTNASSNVNNAAALFADVNPESAGSIDNAYGLYVDMDGGTSRYGVYVDTGGPGGSISYYSTLPEDEQHISLYDSDNSVAVGIFSGTGDPNSQTSGAGAGSLFMDEAGSLWVATAGGDASWSEIGLSSNVLWLDGTNGYYSNTEAIIVGADAAFSYGSGAAGDLKVDDELEVVGDAWIDNDLVVGASTSSTETLSNAGFTLGGDDLFVAGLAGVEGNVYTDGSFITGATTTYADGSITTSSNSNFSIIPGGTGYTIIGDAGTSDHSLAEDDLFVSDRLEVDSVAFFDGAVYYGDSNSNFLGSGADSGWRWSTQETNDSMMFFTDTNNAAFSGNIMFANKDYRTTDHGVPTVTNPTIRLFSAADPGVDNTQWLSLVHNQTDAVMATGSGDLIFNPNADTDDYIYLETASDIAYMYWSGTGVATNDPGFRVNTSNQQLEYRDQDDATWTAFETLASGATLWEEGTTATYLTDATEDWAIGATDTLVAPLSMDISANLLRIGDGTSDANDPTITFYASNASDSGSIEYTDNDSFYFSGGEVGIGTNTPNATLDIVRNSPTVSPSDYNGTVESVAKTTSGTSVGIWNALEVANTVSSSSPNYGLNSFAYHTGTADLTSESALIGGRYVSRINSNGSTITGANGASAYVEISNGYSSTITNARAFYAEPIDAEDSTITNAYEVYVSNPTSDTGSVTNAYGLYLESINGGATTNYSIYSAGGNNYLAGNTAIGSGTGYLNFNTTYGSSGYGFRDNSGTMEYKDDGGSWTDFASLSGVTGSAVANQMTYWSDTTEISGSSNFTYDTTDLALTLPATGSFAIDAATTDSTEAGGVQTITVDSSTDLNYALDIDYELTDDNSAGANGQGGVSISPTQSSNDGDNLVGMNIDDLAGTAGSGFEIGVMVGTDYDFGLISSSAGYFSGATDLAVIGDSERTASLVISGGSSTDPGDDEIVDGIRVINQSDLDPANGQTVNLYGIDALSHYNGADTDSTLNVAGVYAYGAASSGTGTTNVFGVDALAQELGGTVANAYGIRAQANTAATTNYGVYAAVSGGTTNYAGIFTGGNVGIGTATPTEELHIYGDSPLTSNNIVVNVENADDVGLAQYLLTNDSSITAGIGLLGSNVSSILSDASYDDRLLIKSDSGSTGIDFMVEDTTSDIRFAVGGFGSTDAVFDNTGFVIGADSANALFEVSAAENTELIRLTDEDNTDEVGLYLGADTPESAVTADTGSLYFDADASGALWVKATGEGTDTGWSQLATASSIALTWDEVYDEDRTNDDGILDIDADHLEFESTGTYNYIVDLQSDGNFIVQDAGTAFFTFDDGGYLDFNFAGTTESGFDMDTTTITSGTGIDLNINNSGFTGTGLNIVSDDASASGELITLQQDGTGDGISLDYNGSSTTSQALYIDQDWTTTAIGASYDANIIDVDIDGDMSGAYTVQGLDLDLSMTGDTAIRAGNIHGLDVSASYSGANWSNEVIAGQFTADNTTSSVAVTNVYGIYSKAQETSGDTQTGYGGYFLSSDASMNYGISAEVSGSGYNTAVDARSSSADSLAYGVNVSSISSAASSVYGVNITATGNGGLLYGINSTVNSNSGSNAVYGIRSVIQADTGTGTNYGLYSYLNGAYQNDSYGLYVVHSDTGGNSGAGILIDENQDDVALSIDSEASGSPLIDLAPLAALSRGAIALGATMDGDPGSTIEGDLWYDINGGSDGQLCFDDGTASPVCVNSGNLGASGEWTDTGTILHPNEETVDEIAIGGTTEAGADIFLGVDGTAVFNEQGAAVDFRIESDTNANMFFVDGSDNEIGIGTNAPVSPFHISSSETGNIWTLSAGTTTGYAMTANVNDLTSGRGFYMWRHDDVDNFTGSMIYLNQENDNTTSTGNGLYSNMLGAGDAIEGSKTTPVTTGTSRTIIGTHNSSQTLTGSSFLYGTVGASNFTGDTDDSFVQLQGIRGEATFSGTAGTAEEDVYGSTGYANMSSAGETVNISAGAFGRSSASNGTISSAYGVYGEVYPYSSGAITTGYGVYGYAREVTDAMTTGYGGYFRADNATTNYGMYAQATTAATTNYGIYATASGATNNYAGIFANGNVGIGDTTPDADLDILSDAVGESLLNLEALSNVDQDVIHLENSGTGTGFRLSNQSSSNAYGIYLSQAANNQAILIQSDATTQSAIDIAAVQTSGQIISLTNAPAAASSAYGIHVSFVGDSDNDGQPIYISPEAGSPVGQIHLGTGQNSAASAAESDLWYDDDDERLCFETATEGTICLDENTGGMTGFGTDTYVTFWTGADSLSGEASFTYDDATNYLYLDGGIYRTSSSITGTTQVNLGVNSTLAENYSTIAGGQTNEIDHPGSSSGEYAFIGGGRENKIYDSSGTGGFNGTYSVITGGYQNYIYSFGTGSNIGAWAFIGGGRSNRIYGNANNEGQYSLIVGGYNNYINAGYYNSIVGGSANYITSTNINNIIGGGTNNRITGGAYGGFIGSGSNNQISNDGYVTIGGGADHTASGNNATIAGGLDNTVSSIAATVGGGSGNTASQQYSTVTGGYQNTASGSYSTISGGLNNTNAGVYSWAAGQYIDMSSAAWYSFAFGYDGGGDGIDITRPNSFLIFPNDGTDGDPGEVGIGTVNPSAKIDIVNVSGDAYPGIEINQANTAEPHLSLLGITADPSSLTEGDIWYEATDGEFCFYDGATTVCIDSSGVVGAGGGEWADTGSILHPNEETVDEIAIGGTTEGASDIFFGVDGDAVFNEIGNDADFRIESDTNANMFTVNAGEDSIGINSAGSATADITIIGEHNNILDIDQAYASDVATINGIDMDISQSTAQTTALDMAGNDISLTFSGDSSAVGNVQLRGVNSVVDITTTDASSYVESVSLRGISQMTGSGTLTSAGTLGDLYGVAGAAWLSAGTVGGELVGTYSEAKIEGASATLDSGGNGMMGAFNVARVEDDRTAHLAYGSINTVDWSSTANSATSDVYGNWSYVSHSSGANLDRIVGISASAAETGAAAVNYAVGGLFSASGASANYSIFATGAAVHIDDSVLASAATATYADAAGELYVELDFESDGNVYLGDADTDDIAANGEFITDLIPNADDNYDLGSTSKRWQDLYLGPSTLHIGSNGDESQMTYTTASDLLTFQNSADSVTAFQFLDADGGTPILNIDGTNERVGIGTAAPSAKIDIVNPIASAIPGIEINQTNTAEPHMALLGITAEPTSLSEGDFWYETGASSDNPNSLCFQTSSGVVCLDSSAGVSHWQDGGAYIYPTDAGNYGGTGMQIQDDGDVFIDGNMKVDGITAFGDNATIAATHLVNADKDFVAANGEEHKGILVAGGPTSGSTSGLSTYDYAAVWADVDAGFATATGNDSIAGYYADTIWSGAGTANGVYGAKLYGTATGAAGLVTGVRGYGDVNGGSATGVYGGEFYASVTSGSATDAYGIYTGATGATNNYAIYSGAGNAYIQDGLIVGDTDTNITNKLIYATEDFGTSSSLFSGVDIEVQKTSNGANLSNALYGIDLYTYMDGDCGSTSGTCGTYGIYNVVEAETTKTSPMSNYLFGEKTSVDIPNATSLTMSYVYGSDIDVDVSNANATVSNLYGQQITTDTSGGAATTVYGTKIDAGGGTTTTYGMWISADGSGDDLAIYADEGEVYIEDNTRIGNAGTTPGDDGVFMVSQDMTGYFAWDYNGTRATADFDWTFASLTSDQDTTIMGIDNSISWDGGSCNAIGSPECVGIGMRNMLDYSTGYGTGTSTAYGFYQVTDISTTDTINVSDLYGMYLETGMTNENATVTGDMVGLYVDNTLASGTEGSVSGDNYGIYINVAAQNVSGTTYAMYADGGPVFIDVDGNELLTPSGQDMNIIAGYTSFNDTIILGSSTASDDVKVIDGTLYVADGGSYGYPGLGFTLSDGDVVIGDELSVGADMSVRGDAIYMSNNGTADEDAYIYFEDGGTYNQEFFQWDDGDEEFNMTADLTFYDSNAEQALFVVGSEGDHDIYIDPYIGGTGEIWIGSNGNSDDLNVIDGAFHVLSAGSTANINYTNSDGDAYVNTQLEVDSHIRAGTSIYFNGPTGDAEGDHALFFYENSSIIGAQMYWDDSEDEFAFNHPIKIDNDNADHILEVIGDRSTAASHIVNIENTDTSNTADGMRIKVYTTTANHSDANDYINFLNGSANVGSIEGNSGAASVSYSTSGADYAELFPGNRANFSAGDVITLDTSGDIEIGQTSSMIIGAYSVTPAVVGNWEQDWGAGTDTVPVGLLGQIDMKVTDENGSIVAGDPLTLSSTDGYVMKADKAGVIVGRALENFAGPGTGTINVLVQPQWTAEGVFGTDGTITTLSDNIGLTAINTSDASNTVYDSYEFSFRGSVWNGSDEEEVEMKLTNTVTDSTDYRLSVTNTADAEVAYVNSDGDLSISGRIYPSDRGTMQEDKYIYYDGSTGLGGDMMRTNASGWSTGSYDFAEMFPSNQYLEAGEVVTIDPANQEHVKRAIAPYDEMVVGVISTKPGFLAGDNNPNEYPVALAGRVPVLVSTENGAIAAGDPLTSSNTTGVAMKATEPGRIIGYALDEYSGTGIGTVIMFVEAGWWGGATEVVDGGSGSGGGSVSGDATLDSLSMYGDIAMMGNNIIGIARLAGISDRWSVDEEGAFNTEGGYSVTIESHQGEDVEAHAVLSPEHKITLAGTGQLSNGQANIEFNETNQNFNGIISTVEDYRVLITLTEEANGVYVTDKTNSGFRVLELNGGNSSATFDWYVEAYRKDYEPSAAVCGNLVIEEGEECDDGNATDGDGCSAACLNEVVAECGNGEVEGDEECDDGNTEDDDGCSAMCLLEEEPVEAVCGDGVIEGTEECDDGNTEDGDGCSAMCVVETVPEPELEPEPEPEPVCGDGVVEGTEECDDGNTEDGDGCSSVCEIELPPEEPPPEEPPPEEPPVI